MCNIFKLIYNILFKNTFSKQLIDVVKSGNILNLGDLYENNLEEVESDDKSDDESNDQSGDQSDLKG